MTPDRPVPPKLMMFYGAGSGSGKSILSNAIYQRLLRRGVSATYVAEESMLASEEFRPYVSAVPKGEGWDIDALLDSCTTFLNTYRNSSRVYVTDSILPCSDWLLTAGVLPETIATFAQKLAGAMVDLPSLFVFVECDVHVALDRAIADRGEDWARSLAVKRCGTDDLNELLGYFGSLQDLGKQLWQSWPHRKVSVDTVRDTSESCESQIIGQIPG